MPISPVMSQRLLEYAHRHSTFHHLNFPLHEQEFVQLAEKGQAPKTLFIGCSDSRVIPELLLQAKPGELFVIRTAGNFVPIYDATMAWDGVAATIQYAVEALGVTDIIVCGHSNCGAIAALFSDTSLDLVQHWLRFGQEAKQAALLSIDASDEVSLTEQIRIAEYLSVMSQLDHLLTFPFVKRKVDTNQLHLHGWYFSVDKGEIAYYNPATYQFSPLRSLIHH